MIKLNSYELNFEYTRSRGPGGQNVNRTNSAAVLRFNLLHTQSFSAEQKQRLLDKLGSNLNEAGDLVIRSDAYRDQDQNRKACIEKLQNILQKALFKPRKRVATKPTKSSVRKRLEGKRRHSEKKQSRKISNHD